jgi:hypothetical protein
MPATHLLVMVHGMTTIRQPAGHQADYDALWAALVKRRPSLRNAFAKTVRVEWGHRPPDVPTEALRDDQRITDAENTISDRVSYAAVKADQSPNNHLLGPHQELFSAWVTRHLTDPIKETVEIFGVADVFYYCAPEGETAVRYAVYTQVLDALEEFRNQPDVRLHVIAHSLGVTVAHDFLFGLFAPEAELTGGVPGFLANPKATEQDKERYAFWRARAQPENGTLLLGSKSSTAGQLPLTAMRKQKLVNRLATGDTLDPTVIGVPASGPVKWKIFYDVDDVLGFPVRRLYDPVSTIAEYQVNTNWRPDLAHEQYWTNPTVVAEVAELLSSNLT